MRRLPPLLATAALAMASLAEAANIDCGVGGKAKIFDRLSSVGTAKILYRSAKLPCVQKGPGGLPSQVSGTFDILYVDAPGSVQGAFVMPAPWTFNEERHAKFLNTASPGGPSQARKVGVKAEKLARFGSRGLGDTGSIDITNPPGPGGVLAILSVHNAVDGNTYRMCTKWALSSGSSIRHQVVDGGAGRKLFLERGVPSSCSVIPTTTSTSTSSTTTTSTSIPTTTSTSTSSTTTTSLMLQFVTGAAGGSCGAVRSGGAGGTVRKTLTCGGLNVGAGASTVAEGPTPSDAQTRLRALCSGAVCTIGPITAAQAGSNNVCSAPGCAFGPYLPIANAGTSTCVRNTFSAPASGTLDTTAGTFTGSFPLTSAVYLTGNATSPCPLCVGGTPGVTNSGTCDPTWAAGVGPSPDAGAACTPVNAAGDSHDCDPPAGALLPSFPVDLTPITTGTAFKADASGLFCPGQTTPGAFGCQGSGAANAICPGGNVPPVIDYIEEVGAPAGPLTPGTHPATLASVFCIPSVGGSLGFLINSAANLPGPGATSLPGTLQLIQ
ncbi:MAG TPA: hypothetical protein VNO26_05460 [Candidatus Limnocylindria bacterium]|nr:hypothetical protein [Candidatus Limnocylindria bacterium]